MDILSPARLFAEAATTPLSAPDKALTESIQSLKATDPDPDDETLDAFMQAGVKHAMRCGRKDIYLSITEECRNAAALQMLAHRWRQAGFDAQANPELPMWCKLLLITRSNGIRLRWDPVELAAQAAGS